MRVHEAEGEQPRQEACVQRIGAGPERPVHAPHGQQLQEHETDRKDSVWPTQVCQFELVRASFVPPRPFRELRPLSRHRGA